MKSYVLAALLLMLVGIAYASNEITITAYLKAEKSYASIIRSPAAFQLTWSGSKIFGPSTYACTTGYQALAKGAINTNGYCFVRNNSTGSLVIVSFDASTSDALQFKPGEYGLFRIHPTLNITNVMVKTAAGTADFEVTLLED